MRSARQLSPNPLVQRGLAWLSPQMPQDGRQSLRDRAVRFALTALHGLLKLNWFVRRPRTFGAHAIAMTAERRIILVKLRYAPGWRVPGGGRAKTEHPREAILRELREEIGMSSHGRVRIAAELEEESDFKHDLASLLIVEDVQYRPRRWSWEVEQVREFSIDNLPSDLSPRSARWIDAMRPRI